MERYINTRKRNGGKATFKNDVTLSLLLIKSALVALSNDITQHLLDLFNRICFGQLL